MNGYLNRWTVALGWVVAMAIVWTLFVPRGLSVTTFTLLGVTGLAISLCGSTLVRNSQPPRSINQILLELEAEPTNAHLRSGTR